MNTLYGGSYRARKAASEAESLTWRISVDSLACQPFLMQWLVQKWYGLLFSSIEAMVIQAC